MCFDFTVEKKMYWLACANLTRNEHLLSRSSCGLSDDWRLVLNVFMRVKRDVASNIRCRSVDDAVQRRYPFGF